MFASFWTLPTTLVLCLTTCVVEYGFMTLSLHTVAHFTRRFTLTYTHSPDCMVRLPSKDDPTSACECKPLAPIQKTLMTWAAGYFVASAFEQFNIALRIGKVAGNGTITARGVTCESWLYPFNGSPIGINSLSLCATIENGTTWPRRLVHSQNGMWWDLSHFSAAVQPQTNFEPPSFCTKP